MHPPTQIVRHGDTTSRSSLSAERARAFLLRKGVPSTKQAAYIADLFQLSPAQSYRRLAGPADWTLEDLTKLASAFGSTLVEVVAPDIDEDSVKAAIRIGLHEYPCKAWLGEVIAHPKVGALIAFNENGQWIISPASASNSGRAVLRAVVLPDQKHIKRIAVLDDHPASVASIAEYLASNSHETVAFDRIQELALAMQDRPFDAYILDWLVGDEDVGALIQAIRKKDLEAPIIVLTGQSRSGLASDAAIADAIAKYDVAFFEKPISLSILSASLSNQFKRPLPA